MVRLAKHGLWAVVLAGAGLAAVTTAAVPQNGQISLVPHRAVYDLKLLRTKSSRGIDGIRGRIVYDFSGNSCEGYALDFRP